MIDTSGKQSDAAPPSEAPKEENKTTQSAPEQAAPVKEEKKAVEAPKKEAPPARAPVTPVKPKAMPTSRK